MWKLEIVLLGISPTVRITRTSVKLTLDTQPRWWLARPSPERDLGRWLSVWSDSYLCIGSDRYGLGRLPDRSSIWSRIIKILNQHGGTGLCWAVFYSNNTVKFTHGLNNKSHHQRLWQVQFKQSHRYAISRSRSLFVNLHTLIHISIFINIPER